MFKEIHKTVERIRNSGFKPHEMKEEYASLTEQKERLNEKILRIKKKLERVVQSCLFSNLIFKAKLKRTFDCLRSY